METRDLAIVIGQALTGDEELLRILHYVPEFDGDDPLDESKPSLLDNDDIDEKWALINTHIKNTPKTDDLTVNPIGRVLFFMGRRSNGVNNPDFDDQDVVFDVIMHEDYAINYQLEMAVDYLIKAFNDRQLGRFDRPSDQKVGIGRLKFDGSEPIGSISPGYIGHRIVFVATLRGRARVRSR
ncbi:hypothetical protein [Exiguobacterium sp. s133]|uniref:hypothetical protein n=1 Tax=Exiguobacterium sp. s133 TaxID=2751213 RepID=UPI001BEBC2F3|nr:hypothetical protein [Exiguobacterium sp. s133]